VLTLLDAGRVPCQTTQKVQSSESPLVTSLSTACDPVAQDCKEQVIALEVKWELAFRSRPHDEEITIQELKKAAQNLPVPGAVNFYEGKASFGTKPRFKKRAKIGHWKPFMSGFDLRGFVEMCCLDPLMLNGRSYELEYDRDEMLLERPCRVYRVKPKEPSKGRYFAGTIWVLRESLAIVRANGGFYPLRKTHFPVEDHWFIFDTWRKEISPGNWVPDFTCTGVSFAESDFTNPAFQARIIYHYGMGTQPNAASGYACGMESIPFATQTAQSRLDVGQIQK